MLQHTMNNYEPFNYGKEKLNIQYDILLYNITTILLHHLYIYILHMLHI